MIRRGVLPGGKRGRIVLGPLLVAIVGLLSGCTRQVDVLNHVDAGPTGNGLVVCPALPGAPSSAGPLPTAAQAAYQRAELTATLHFGINTFDGTEYGDAAKDSPALFDPLDLDANQWIEALAGAGFRQVMLVVKHSTGFCLWPSAYTDYSVGFSPWKEGRGDVVQAFTEAARAAGLRVGYSLSPWDGDFPSSAAAYQDYFRNQLTELLTRYGPIQEMSWGGYLAPTGMDWPAMVRLAKQLQPEALVWMGPEIATTGADLRYIGNQNGQASRATSSLASVPNGGPANVWYPADAPASLHQGAWFWHPNATRQTLKALQTMYFNTVGMNTTLVLNVPPATSGRIDAPDLALLQQFGAWYADLYTTNRLRGQPGSASSTWGSGGFGPAQALDDDPCTYWAAGTSAPARLEVVPAAPVAVKLVSIREPIELGERTTKYHVEFKQNGAWIRSPVDSSGVPIEGTVIGQRQLWQVTTTTVEAVALVIDSARDLPAIAEFSVY